VTALIVWATVSKTVRPMLSDRCLSVLSVTLVYCGQTIGWINMKLGMKVCLGPGHIVLGVDPAPPPQRGRATLLNFRPISLWPNGWMNQDATWYGGRPQPRGLFVLDGHPARSPKRGGAPQFSPHVCCGQTLVWTKMPLGMEVGLGPGDVVFDGDAAPQKKRHTPLPPNFWPCLLWPNGWMDEDAT